MCYCSQKWEITMTSSVKSGKLQGHPVSVEGVVVTTNEDKVTFDNEVWASKAIERMGVALFHVNLVVRRNLFQKLLSFFVTKISLH